MCGAWRDPCQSARQKSLVNLKITYFDTDQHRLSIDAFNTHGAIENQCPERLFGLAPVRLIRLRCIRKSQMATYSRAIFLKRKSIAAGYVNHDGVECVGLGPCEEDETQYEQKC